MATQWYFQVMGQVMGPVDARILKDRVRAGDIGRETLVRKGETGEWILAERIADLFQPIAPPRFDENVVAPPKPAETAAAPRAATPTTAAPTVTAPAPAAAAPEIAEAEETDKKGKKKKAKTPKAPKVKKPKSASPFVYAITDRSFTRFVAPQILSTLQTIVLILGLITFAYAIFAAISDPIAGGMAAAATVLVTALSVAMTRVLLECVLLLFRIADRLGDVRDMGVPPVEPPSAPPA